jgi:tripartite-type tricarboxylate transporter receptor subunit TctC
LYSENEFYFAHEVSNLAKESKMKRREKGLSFSGKMAVVCAMATFLVFGQGLMAQAADKYPEKAIEVVVGYKAGGLVDSIARTISATLSENLGVPVVAINKGGAGGGIAASDVAAAAPDGYRLVISSNSTFTYNPLAGSVTYTMEDFDYLVTLARMETAFVSLKKKPWTDLVTMFEYAKKNNKVLKYVPLTPSDRKQIMKVAKKTGVNIIPLPAKGGAKAMQMILGGHVDFAYSGGIHQQYVKSGDMIVLAASGNTRLNSSPEVPSMVELGYPGVPLVCVVAAPKGLPEDVRSKLEASLLKAASDKKVLELLNKNNMQMDPIGSGETTSFLQNDLEELKQL